MERKSINKLDYDLFYLRKTAKIPSQHIGSTKVSIAKLDNDLFCFRMARGTPKAESDETECGHTPKEDEIGPFFEN